MNFCTRKELSNGPNLVNFIFNAISEKLMFEEKEYRLNYYLALDGSQELPTTKMPKNIVGGMKELDIE